MDLIRNRLERYIMYKWFALLALAMIPLLLNANAIYFPPSYSTPEVTSWVSQFSSPVNKHISPYFYPTPSKVDVVFPFFSHLILDITWLHHRTIQSRIKSATTNSYSFEAPIHFVNYKTPQTLSEEPPA